MSAGVVTTLMMGQVSVGVVTPLMMGQVSVGVVTPSMVGQVSVGVVTPSMFVCDSCVAHMFSFEINKRVLGMT